MTRRSAARDVRGAVVHVRVVSAVWGTTLVVTGVGLGTAEPDLLWAAVLAGVLGVWSLLGALRSRLALTSESVIVASPLRTRRIARAEVERVRVETYDGGLAWGLPSSSLSMVVLLTTVGEVRCYASAAPRRHCRRVVGRLRAELAAAPR